MKKFLIALFTLVVSSITAQIYEPEGLNMPGAWNGWTNVPTNNLALANPGQVPGGRLVKITQGQTRWQTTFSVALSGADLIGGSYEFVFSSGPSGSPWNNTWKNSSFSLNNLTNLTFNSGGNNSITISNGKWYTMNWLDAGYTASKAIFMETSAQPVTFSSVSQTPLNGSVFSSNDVTINVIASAAPSPEELVYVRYSTNNYTTSTLAPVTFTGVNGTATIPAQAGGTNVSYYVLSTTVANPAMADIDMHTLRLNNNGSTYGYTVSSGNPSYNVTFQVNMNEQTISPNGVRIAGSFQGWNPSSTVMTDDNNDGIYTYTASLEQGSSIEYKFINGNDWPQSENVPGSCSTGGNRTYVVGSSDATIGSVCFGSCVNCAGLQNVTFQVNMATQSVSPNGVHLAGNFQGWNPSATPMSDPDADGIYTVTLQINGFSNLQYKFVNGNAWGSDESVPSACASGGNRTYTTGASAEVIPVVCYGSCENCPNNLVSVTFKVNMAGQSVSANGVHVAGNFQGWNPGSTSLSDADSDGIYEVTVSVSPNSTLEYKFVNGNNWGSDESVPAACATSGNRTLVVGTAPIVNEPVCYGACINCLFNTIVFRVDMNQQTVSPNGVHIAGNFQGWNPSSSAMIDADNDGVYTFTASILVDYNIEYKFINGNTWGDAESVPVDCSTNTNRTFNTGAQSAIPVSTNLVCFSSCTICCTPVNYWLDGDNDGYGGGSPLSSCSNPGGDYTTISGDCDDSDGDVNPEGEEVCGNGIDDDCLNGDLVCPQVGPAYAVAIANIGQFGTGVQSTTTVNLVTAGDSPQNSGAGNDRWYSFTAASNAIRIALNGSINAGDDNEISIYEGATSLGAMIPLVQENDVHPGAQGLATDGGTETLLYDGLTPNQPYFICIRNTNATPGINTMVVSYLNASLPDIGPYTGYTGNYTSACQNFKVRFRPNASGYTVKRWSSSVVSNSPIWQFTTPNSGASVASTVFQLSRIAPANLSSTNATIYVTVDVNYNLKDAFGNTVPVTAVGTLVSSFTMSPELPVIVRTSDACPISKSPTTGTVATNRSVCGTSQYQWQFEQQIPTAGLTVLENGALGGSRSLPLSIVDGIGTGQTYQVKIRSVHADASQSAFSSNSCVKTIGVAGMPTLEQDGIAAERSFNGVTSNIYPNPNTGDGVVLNVNGMEGMLQVNITDVTGKLIHRNQLMVEGSLTTNINFDQALSNGLYLVELTTGQQSQTMRMVVNR
jgi:hypothetical protein